VEDIDGELQRSKETLDNANNRLASIESSLGQADDIVRSLKTEIQSMTKAFTDKISQFQN